MLNSRSLGDLNQHVSGYKGKNALINGNFSVWQRGTSFTDIAGYTADQWETPAGGSATGRDIARITASVNDNKEYGIEYSLRLTSTAQANIDNRIFQYIEAISPGNTVTLSLLAKASSIDHKISVSFRTISNLGDDNRVQLHAQEVSASWAKFQWTFTVPDLPAGASAADSYSLLVVEAEQLTDTFFEFANIQLEDGVEATEFDGEPHSITLLKCQRYYWRSSPVSMLGKLYAGEALSNNAMAGSVDFPVRMYAAPTVTELIAPTYENCSAVFPLSNEDGIVYRVTIPGAGTYRAWGGEYEAVASIG